MTEATPHHGLSRSTHFWTWLIIVCWLSGSGCANVPYRYGRFHPQDENPPTEVAIEYGKPQKTLDNIAWFTGIWSRLLSMNSEVNVHGLSEDNKEKLLVYLNENDLNDVLVRVNQYDPKGEWRRLRENRRIGPGWRYTVGVLSMAHYTLIPGRVFGGDEYNPYTNTLYINSDLSAVALHEAAYAKDIHSRRLPGSYAVMNEVPLLSLWRHTKGVNDVLGYAQINDDWSIESETYRVVYPQMGIHSTGFAGLIVPFWDGILFSVAGATAGHATGRVALAQRRKERNARMNDSPMDQSSESAELLAEESDDDSATIQVTNHQTESPDDDDRK